MSRTATVVFLLWVATVVGLGANYVLNYQKKAAIKIEAPPALSRHPISSEFGTGYILVEVWTTDGENKYPHIVRMKRSEYLEWVRPKQHK